MTIIEGGSEPDIERTLDTDMNVVLRLLGFTRTLISFGKWVYMTVSRRVSTVSRCEQVRVFGTGTAEMFIEREAFA